jgi:hypothetical protein
VDGTRLVGRPLGAVGATLRFRALHPTRGPLLLPFAEVEPLSLHGALLSCLPPGDPGALLGLARLAADGGLADEALRDLDRMTGDVAGLEEEIAALRARVAEDAARRELEDARDHFAHRRTDHARAALDDLLSRFPASLAAPEARVLRRTLAALPD